MNIFEVESTFKVYVTKRFLDDFAKYARATPKLIDILKEFLHFRATHLPVEPFGAKDGRLTSMEASEIGLRRFHMIHGKLLLLYILRGNDSIYLYGVAEHKIIDSKSGLSVFVDFAKHAKLIPYETESEKTLSKDQVQEVIALIWDMSANDRYILENFINGNVSDFMEFACMLVSNTDQNDETVSLIIRSFNGMDNLIKQIKTILSQTNSN